MPHNSFCSECKACDILSHTPGNKASCNLQVEVRHGSSGNGGPRRAYKVKGLTLKAADEAEFENEQEGTSMTVAQYFQQAYGIG